MSNPSMCCGMRCFLGTSVHLVHQLTSLKILKEHRVAMAENSEEETAVHLVGLVSRILISQNTINIFIALSVAAGYWIAPFCVCAR